MALLAGSTSFLNVTSNLQNLVLGTGATITNDYVDNAKMIYINGSNCSLCTLIIVDAKGTTTPRTADEFGWVYAIPVTEYEGDGGGEETSLFLIDGNDQYNETASLIFYTTHSFLGYGENLSWTGVNYTYVNKPETVWIVVSPPPDYYPMVALVAPPDHTTTNDSAIGFIYTATDDVNLMNTSLWTNFTGTWAINQTNSSEVIFGAMHIFSVGVVVNGTYVWNVQACDNAGQCAMNGVLAPPS
jgi:hypothetical protein